MNTQSSLQELAANINQKDQYPVVIIGSGIGGLMAGACLAKNGFPVTVLEKHSKPGGYATTFNRKGFTFDVSLHETIAKGGGVEYLLKAAGIDEKVYPVLLPDLARIITPDDNVIYPQKDPDGLIDVLGKKFPDEKEGIADFVNIMLECAENPEAAFQVLPPLLNLDQFLDKYIKNPRLKTLLGGFYGYYGKSPAELPALFYAIATGSLIKDGAWYYKRRSQDFTDAFVSVIEENGGKVITSALAAKIFTDKENNVTGVQYEDHKNGGEKKTLQARAVISNANAPETVFQMLQGKVSQDYEKKVKNSEPSVSIFNIWLGLNCNLKDKIDGYEIFVFDSHDEKKNLEAINNCDPENVPFVVTIYDNAYEGYSSKPGTGIMSILCLSSFKPWHEFEDEYFKGDKTAYKKKKDYVTSTLIKRTEARLMPGLGAMIEVKEAATPLTNIRFTNNVNGSIYGYKQDFNNCGPTRIKNRVKGITGLYLASAWGDPAGGYNCVLQGGYGAVNDLLEDLGK
jgi:phytoene dehydrogenase-like protein